MSLEPLKQLALAGDIGSSVAISSAKFAQRLKTSPQTASRKLQALEEEHLITRKVLPNGQEVTITEEGMLALWREYREYQQIFGEVEDLRLTGLVCTGLGEGRYYVMLEGYLRQFEQKLGFTPYPGTLNIELSPHSITTRKKLQITDDIPLSGFEDGERTFGSVKCFRARINDLHGAIVIPNRKNYPDNVVEIVAPVNLREHLSVSDGSEVEVVLCRA